jgi:hypothetical protein
VEEAVKEHYCTQTEYFCALNFKRFLFLNVFFNAASSAEPRIELRGSAAEAALKKYLKITKKTLGLNRIVATFALSVRPSTLG